MTRLGDLLVVNTGRILILGLALVHGAGFAQELYEHFPDVIHPDQKYVFYSHGFIVEGDDPRPEHPEFGVYDFPEVKRALFEGGDFNLIAHHRPANTEARAYADRLVGWVEQLLNAGVRPGDITLVGFSRGAQITARAASDLRDTGINTVLMALCFNGDYAASPAYVLGGDVFSIFETSDVVGSCNLLLERSTGASSTRELAISTGRSHGAFYTPRVEWLKPLRDWLAAPRP